MMDQDKLYSMIDYAYDRLNEVEAFQDDQRIKIGICIGEARKTIYDILNQLDSEDQNHPENQSESYEELEEE